MVSTFIGFDNKNDSMEIWKRKKNTSWVWKFWLKAAVKAV